MKTAVKKCWVEDCGNESKTCGYCHKHYKRIQVYGDENFTKQSDLKGKICKEVGCDRPARKVFLCNSHYTKAWQKNNPEKAKENQRHSWGRRRIVKKGVAGSHTNKQWKDLLKQHDGKCHYCKTSDATTKDHIIPISQGGTDDISNILPACRSCNCKKHTKSYEDFVLLIAHNERNHDVQPLRISEQGINIGGNYYGNE